jgi:hypothetical protein
MESAGGAGKVRPGIPGLQTTRGKQGRNGLRLPSTELDNEMTARPDETRCVGGKGAISIETVGATVESAQRIAVANLRCEPRNVSAPNVRRIGHDEIERTGKRRAEVTSREARTIGKT